ncbi:MAG: class I SAM-dependent methyltransferase [Candidatus Tectimicrobiota bacterium]
MPIDFHTEQNRYTYATRQAHVSWQRAITALVEPQGKRVVDIGCGGGIYAQAWAHLGAASVRGVDFAAQMVQVATEGARHLPQISFSQGNALNTGLPDGCADIVFARALVHHVGDLPACLAEAYRLLSPGGVYIIQDRTLEDVRIPGSREHLRGYFFSCFPRLLAVEAARRPHAETVLAALAHAGFTQAQSTVCWEIRQTYPDAEALSADLRQRTGRSILHELSDAELARLIDVITAQLPAHTPVVEQDRWTLWWAARP